MKMGRTKHYLTILVALLLLGFFLMSVFNKDEFSTSMELQPKEKSQKNLHVLCRSRSEYHSHENIKLDPKIVNGVDTMLMFIGYPRSGHTLIGSILDAHPNMVIANEYNVLALWQNYTRGHRNKQYLFEQLYKNSFAEARHGDRSTDDCFPKTKYKYLVPNQWQGKFDGEIKVIGDKKGGSTTGLLASSSRHWSTLNEMQQELKIPMKFIHVVRNPFDMMATMALRIKFGDHFNKTQFYNSPVTLSKTQFSKYIKYRMKFARINAQFIKRYPGQVYTMKSEDMIREPEFELRKICKYLNVHCSNEYIRDCVSIVNNQISKTRNTIVWEEDLKKIVYDHIRTIPFYSDYKFDE